ncbi:iron ABC transporter permease [Romboutsia sp.]|uniref:FecCD family ABC transporter permease n=1 Tax=Romboutsia sp. TaxID=1965302 RepID=UPI002C1B12F5|nr:iron ABC transporter permease [Romboutsia sp.]HSQ87823.1 iron ABC transporter permease [Romboutsia sp.]
MAQYELNEKLLGNNQREKKRNRQLIFIGILLFFTVIVFLLSVSIGSVNIGLENVIKIFVGGNIENSTYKPIVMNIRLPRALATVIGGACLAISGLLLQIFFRNPIVEPYVLGVSSGATLFVGIVVLGGYTFGLKYVTPMFLFGGAFIGSMTVMLIVVFATKKVKNITTLLIIGIMAGFICSAMTSILVAFADKEKITGYLMWTMGSFSGFSWTQVKYLYLIGTPFIAITFMISKPLNAMLFGEKYAISMGLNIKVFRIIIVLISSVLTAVITAFAGPISFIGLAVPHMVRITFATSDNKILIPAVIISGAFMMCVCDLGARMLLSPIELPLGAITSLIGAPIVLYLLLRKENAL